MNLPAKRFVSPSPNKPATPLRRGGPRERGYALLVLMMMVTVLLISLSAALPSVYVAGQREREEELIFRGNEYARAISLFYRQFRRYPASVEELSKKIHGVRFLRRAYPDPMSRNGKWRFIHADANGILIDSRTQPRASSMTDDARQPPTPDPGKETPKSSEFFGKSGEMGGAFIVGVASTSKRESIRIYNDRTHYDEWEFLGLVAGQGLAQPPSPDRPAQQSPELPTQRTLTEKPSLPH